MMRMRTKLTGLSPPTNHGNNTTATATANDGVGGGGGDKPENWELRPCGMLVQKRVAAADQNVKPPPIIRVRVKYGSVYHEVYINSQATFGELKKKLSEPTGLHHEDQKVYYKEKERNSKEFLDVVGVKDKSKLVVVEDPISQEKRFIEMQRNAKLEKASKSISLISLQVDKLASQVAEIESVISKGGRVAEMEVVSLIELLMNELIKLDGIVADGDVKLQRKMQVRRVQKYVETLDVLKVRNAAPPANSVHPNHVDNHERASNGGKPPLAFKQQPKKQQERHSIGHSPLRPQPQRQETVMTTQWETFDQTPPLIALSPTRSHESTPQKPEKPKFPWEFFE